METRLVRARSAAKQPEIRRTVLEEGPPAPILSESADEGVLPTAVTSTEPSEEANSGAFSDEAPIWPDEAAESAFLAGQLPKELVTPPAPPPEVEPRIEDIPTSLPSLDSLVDRIPTESREILEELFRARFVSVKKVSKRTLKK